MCLSSPVLILHIFTTPVFTSWFWRCQAYNIYCFTADQPFRLFIPAWHYVKIMGFRSLGLGICTLPTHALYFENMNLICVCVCRIIFVYKYMVQSCKCLHFYGSLFPFRLACSALQFACSGWHSCPSTFNTVSCFLLRLIEVISVYVLSPNFLCCLALIQCVWLLSTDFTTI